MYSLVVNAYLTFAVLIPVTPAAVRMTADAQSFVLFFRAVGADHVTVTAPVDPDATVWRDGLPVECVPAAEVLSRFLPRRPANGARALAFA